MKQKAILIIILLVLLCVGLFADSIPQYSKVIKAKVTYILINSAGTIYVYLNDIVQHEEDTSFINHTLTMSAGGLGIQNDDRKQNLYNLLLMAKLMNWRILIELSDLNYSNYNCIKVIRAPY